MKEAKRLLAELDEKLNKLRKGKLKGPALQSAIEDLEDAFYYNIRRDFKNGKISIITYEIIIEREMKRNAEKLGLQSENGTASSTFCSA